MTKALDNYTVVADKRVNTEPLPAGLQVELDPDDLDPLATLEDPMLTPAGWPRLVHKGWPVPWVSPRDNLSNMDGRRNKTIRRERLCQVCGCGHEPGSRVVLVGNRAADTTHPNTGIEQTILLSMDDSILHERCARLALARCPRLLRLKVEEDLIVATALIEDVDLFVEPSGNEQFGAFVTDLTLFKDGTLPPSKS